MICSAPGFTVSVVVAAGDATVVPDCGNTSGTGSGFPLLSKKFSVAWTGAVPVFTSVKAVVQPPAKASCAIDPEEADPALVAASAGIVLKAPAGLNSIPSTLIWPPAGVSNSTVPRLPEVCAYV